MGHSMGMRHDGSSQCPLTSDTEDDNTIMLTPFSKDVNNLTWSTCSKNQFLAHFNAVKDYGDYMNKTYGVIHPWCLDGK